MNSPYLIMWLIVMFDLPVKSKAERKAYTQFRKFLLKDGFDQMQYSIYMRCCPSPENAEVHMKRVSIHVPPEGAIRILQMTDKQFARMRIFEGKKRVKPEKKVTQLEIF